MGSICVVHASLTEYVLFFGTALDTSGHSGPFFLHLACFLFVGIFVTYDILFHILIVIFEL